MTEKQLSKAIKKIIYENNADRSLINNAITSYNIAQSIRATNLHEVTLVCASETFLIDIDFMLSKTRKREAVQARQFVMYFHKKKDASLTWRSLSCLVNLKGHDDAFYAFKRIDDLLEVDKPTQAKWLEFNRLVDERLKLVG